MVIQRELEFLQNNFKIKGRQLHWRDFELPPNSDFPTDGIHALTNDDYHIQDLINPSETYLSSPDTPDATAYGWNWILVGISLRYHAICNPSTNAFSTFGRLIVGIDHYNKECTRTENQAVQNNIWPDSSIAGHAIRDKWGFKVASVLTPPVYNIEVQTTNTYNQHYVGKDKRYSILHDDTFNCCVAGSCVYNREVFIECEYPMQFGHWPPPTDINHGLSTYAHPGCLNSPFICWTGPWSSSDPTSLQKCLLLNLTARCYFVQNN